MAPGATVAPGATSHSRRSDHRGKIFAKGSRRGASRGEKEVVPDESVAEEFDNPTLLQSYYPEDRDSAKGLVPEVLDAVVKIYTTHCEPNYSLPWQMQRQTQSTSSGFVISGRRIITNAHSVEHFTVVSVKKRGSDRKFIAKVLAIGNECDLALLTVEDDDFWVDIEPLTFGSLPELQASVIVVGYPIGGENISVTAGVVSRVEIQEYTHGASQVRSRAFFVCVFSFIDHLIVSPSCSFHSCSVFRSMLRSTLAHPEGLR